MGIESIKFYQFRNILDSEIDLRFREIILIGENGQGKTNFLESVYLTCYGSSFRTHRVERLIKEGSQDGSLLATFRRPEGIKRRVLMKLSLGKRKEMLIDSRSVKDRKVLLEDNPCIIFSHGDMDYVTGPPERRRRFFNQILSYLDPLFIDHVRKYRKILQGRNRALKNRQLEILDVLDTQLIQSGIPIQEGRRTVISDFNDVLTKLYGEVSGTEENLKLRYKPSWKGENDQERLQDTMKENREREIAYGVTVSGPHRDDVEFSLAEKSFSHTASTGQIRLLALSLKVSQAHYLYVRSGKKPILLLDDVLLELDDKRKDAFVDRLPVYDQVFFTFLPNENYSRCTGKDTKVFEVAGGVLK